MYTWFGIQRESQKCRKIEFLFWGSVSSFTAQFVSWVVRKNNNNSGKEKCLLRSWAASCPMHRGSCQGHMASGQPKPTGEEAPTHSSQEGSCHQRPGLVCIPRGFMESFNELIPAKAPNTVPGSEKALSTTNYWCWFSSVNAVSNPAGSWIQSWMDPVLALEKTH